LKKKEEKMRKEREKLKTLNGEEQRKFEEKLNKKEMKKEQKRMFKVTKLK
jgi:hypothetical protein